MARPRSKHYVSNKEFLVEITEYVTAYNHAVENDLPKPRMSNSLGKKFILIAQRLAYKHNFIKYSFRDEMVDDAIENCIKYAHKFDPNKSSNPFAYFTQYCYNAFIRRIKTEMREFYMKVSMVQGSGAETIGGEYSTQDHDGTADYENGYREFLRNFYDVDIPDTYKVKKRAKRKPKAIDPDEKDITKCFK